MKQPDTMPKILFIVGIRGVWPMPDDFGHSRAHFQYR